jgi:hypothetical protein
MSEQELRERLQRALHKQISAAEWLDIKDRDYVREYDDGDLSWQDLCELVDEALVRLRRHVENTLREQRGELLPETKVPERLPESASVVDISAPLTDRTAARAGALSALDQLRLGPTAWGKVAREISARFRPQGGFDEALPQWVIELKIEAWVPAEDVRSIYQHVQRDLLAEDSYPKTHPRTFNVARFVWEEELRHGKRQSWPVLFERWKEQNPDDKSFKHWRAFHTCFKRGKKATPPRYKDSNDYIASEARRLRQLKERWEEGPRFGLRPY